MSTANEIYICARMIAARDGLEVKDLDYLGRIYEPDMKMTRHCFNVNKVGEHYRSTKEWHIKDGGPDNGNGNGPICTFDEKFKP